MNQLTKSELTPTTAAEALKQSKSKIVKIRHYDFLFRFNEELKVWENKSLLGNENWLLCTNGNMWFANPDFIPYDPLPEVDTELEEAKKLVGTWVKASYAGDDLFLIKKVKRDPSNWDLDLFSDTRKINIKACTPATLPTAAPKWRCMKTDVENTVTPRLVCLDVGYGSYYHVGWYDVAKKAWCVADQYIDLSCYETFEWLEIPRGE